MKNDLRAIRARRRLSQRAVAKAADIELTRYWKIENDYLDPTPEEQAAICRNIGVSHAEAWHSLALRVMSDETLSEFNGKPLKRGSEDT